MAINRFAILTDGFAKPGTIVGSDWVSGIGRTLLITEGYLDRIMAGVIMVVRSMWTMPIIPEIPTCKIKRR